LCYNNLHEKMNCSFTYNKTIFTPVISSWIQSETMQQNKHAEH
jgi:hypothetical protein